MALLENADHDHGYMVPDMVPGRDYERLCRHVPAENNANERKTQYWVLSTMFCDNVRLFSGLLGPDTRGQRSRTTA